MTRSIAIVLATHNGERHLEELLHSLTTQTFPPMELVVGDDCSSDATRDILRAFADHSPFPVRLVLHASRLGYADNFLSTAAYASAPLLAFCDQDDIWSPTKLEVVSRVFDESPDVVLVAHHASLIDDDGRPLKFTFPPHGAAGVYRAGNLPIDHYPGFTVIIRRDLLSVADVRYRPDQGDRRAGLMSHDSWLWLLANCVGQTMILPECLVHYRQHSNNTFGARKTEILKRLQMARDADVCTYLGRAASFSQIAEYLNDLATEWSHTYDRHKWALRARSRAVLYHEWAMLASERAELYELAGRPALTKWLQMVQHGSYQNSEKPVLSASKDLLRLALGSSPTLTHSKLKLA